MACRSLTPSNPTRGLFVSCGRSKDREVCLGEDDRRAEARVGERSELIGRGVGEVDAAAQNDLARLSTNTAHRSLTSATHSMLTEDKATAAKSSQAIHDVVDSVRTGQSLGTGQE